MTSSDLLIFLFALFSYIPFVNAGSVEDARKCGRVAVSAALGNPWGFYEESPALTVNASGRIIAHGMTAVTSDKNRLVFSERKSRSLPGLNSQEQANTTGQITYEFLYRGNLVQRAVVRDAQGLQRLIELNEDCNVQEVSQKTADAKPASLYERHFCEDIQKAISDVDMKQCESAYSKIALARAQFFTRAKAKNLSVDLFIKRSSLNEFKSAVEDTEVCSSQFRTEYYSTVGLGEKMSDGFTNLANAVRRLNPLRDTKPQKAAQ